MAKKSQPSTTKTVNTPSPWVQTNLEASFPEYARRISFLPQEWKGPTIAPATGQSEQLQGLAGTAAPAVGLAGGAQAALGTKWANDMLAGRKDVPLMENYNFSGVDRALEANARPIMEKYTEQLLPSFYSDAAQQGAGTNTRMRLGEEMLGRNLTRELSDSFARLSLDDLTRITEAQPKYDLTQQNLATMLPSLATGAGAQNQYLLGLLQQDQALRQQEIDSTLGAYGVNQELALGPLERMFNVLYGSGGGTSTATTTGAKPGFLQGALQGGLGGAMGASALGASMSNPWTMGAVGLMALLGGLG